MDDYPAADPMPDMDFDEENHNELVDYLKNSREMRETARSSVKQAAFAGGGALAGGFLLGPPGGLVGGIIGSIVGFFNSDDYDGFLVSICKLDDAQKQALMGRVVKVLVTAGATAQQLISHSAFRETLVSYGVQPDIREGIWKACVETLQNA